MDVVLRATAIYLVLLIIMRLAGNRSLAQITAFDFVMLLIIAEATQQALIGDDFSLTKAVLLIVTIIFIDVAFSLLKQRSPRLDRLIDGVPLIIVEHGRPLEDRMRQARVDVSDVMTAARELQGLERLEQVRYAVLERSGGISIIPEPEQSDETPDSKPAAMTA